MKPDTHSEGLGHEHGKAKANLGPDMAKDSWSLPAEGIEVRLVAECLSPGLVMVGMWSWQLKMRCF